MELVHRVHSRQYTVCSKQYTLYSTQQGAKPRFEEEGREGGKKIGRVGRRDQFVANPSVWRVASDAADPVGCTSQCLDLLQIARSCAYQAE